MTQLQWEAAAEWAAREVERGESVEGCARILGVEVTDLTKAVQRYRAGQAGEARRLAKAGEVDAERVVDVPVVRDDVREWAGRMVEFLAAGLTVQDVVWRLAGRRRMQEGESWGNVHGAGQVSVNGAEVRWVMCAVKVFDRDLDLVDVLPDVRGRGLERRGGGKRVYLRLEVADVRPGRLNLRGTSVKLATLLRMHLGEAGTGFCSGADLARAAGVTRAAVSKVEVREAQRLRENTGARARVREKYWRRTGGGCG